MKQYGLLVYQNYNFKRVINIGDYIQSLAAKQYFPQVDHLVDRESLHEYSGPEIKMIMNGWFMHNPSHWPPSEKINPFYIALHINSSCEELMLSQESISHFKKFEPIGCRDKRTAKILKEKGVKCYFSGCLTTTLGNTYKRDSKNDREGVFFVDPYVPFIDNPHNLSSFIDATLLFGKGLRFIATKRKLVLKIADGLYREGYGISQKAKFISKNPLYTFFYKKISKLTPGIFAIIFLSLYSKKFSWELLEEATYIHHLYLAGNFKNEEEKFALAESLIKTYSNAKLVVTSRIHSALPCLSLDTPHIYTAHPQDSTRANKRHHSRFEGLAKLFNTLDYKNRELVGICDEKITHNTVIKNNGNHISLALNLAKKCKNHIATNK